MKKPKKLVIFDIDGTLTDSVTVYHKVVIDSLNLMGMDNVDTDFFNYKYHTDSYTLKVNYESHFNQSFSKSLLNEFENILFSELGKYPPTIEIKGAKNCVRSLLDENFAVAFATGSLPKPAVLKLQQSDIWYKERLIATSKISFDRETFVLQAIENARSYFDIIEFDKIYSVGDGIWDLKTAQRLNLNFIGIGSRQKDILLANGCTTFFNDLRELPAYLI